MARKKLSEWKAKTILSEALGFEYGGISYDTSVKNNTLLQSLDPQKTYVVKVDEGVKKRMKQGLVALDKSANEVEDTINQLNVKGYKHFIIEQFVPHESSSEKYLSIERVRDGLQVLYSQKGGIDVEENQESLKKIIISSGDSIASPNTFWNPASLQNDIGVDEALFTKIIEAFDLYHFSFLEINPLVIEDSGVYFLDIASEVDSAGEFFVKDQWSSENLRTGEIKEETVEEKNIAILSQKSQASFTLNVLNKDGSIFMLLSGGGASIVLADEVYNLGFGKQLANYGEYSGNPNAEEVYLYTKNILSLLLKSNDPQKVLIIGGGVANFTDIRITFKGVIKALEESKEKLQEQKIKVFVRRGGPHQKEGLQMMEEFLKKNSLFGLVSDQTTSLPKIIKKAVEEFSI